MVSTIRHNIGSRNVHQSGRELFPVPPINIRDVALKNIEGKGGSYGNTIYYRLGLITSAPAENKYPYIQYGRLYQDGSQSDLLGELFIKRETSNYNFQEVYLHAAGVVNVTSASTYFELYALSTNAAGAGDTDVNTGSYFGAFKLIQ